MLLQSQEIRLPSPGPYSSVALRLKFTQPRRHTSRANFAERELPYVNVHSFQDGYSRSMFALGGVNSLRIKQLHRINFELQHLCGFPAVVAAFALHGDAADFQVAGFSDFDRAFAVELDCISG